MRTRALNAMTVMSMVSVSVSSTSLDSPVTAVLLASITTQSVLVSQQLQSVATYTQHFNLFILLFILLNIFIIAIIILVLLL